MTPLQQRGFDDALAGRIDEVLATEDSAEGREYRDGKRRAQWKIEDEAREKYPGICDACGEQKDGLVTINCAPVAGASICPDCKFAEYPHEKEPPGIMHGVEHGAHPAMALTFEPSSPPPIDLAPPSPDAPTSVPSVAPGGSAFFDPPTAADKKRKAKAAKETAQLDLFG